MEFDCPKKKKQSEKQSVSAVVAEEGTNSEEDIALVADEHTHRHPITSVLGENGSRLMSR